MRVGSKRGDVLVNLIRVTEAELVSRQPLTHAVVVARSDGRTLLVFNRFKGFWELAGGLIEIGETPRECAVRELGEEAGLRCQPETLRLTGAIELEVQPNARHPEARVEYGALYTVDVEPSAEFVPNEEISDTCWWDHVSPIEQLDAIDRALATLAVPTEGGRLGGGRLGPR